MYVQYRKFLTKVEEWRANVEEDYFHLWVDFIGVTNRSCRVC